MGLSWNEVRARAACFAKDWRDAAYEKGKTQSFYNDFFKVFDVQRRSVARYEERGVGDARFLGRDPPETPATALPTAEPERRPGSQFSGVDYCLQ